MVLSPMPASPCGRKARVLAEELAIARRSALMIALTLGAVVVVLAGANGGPTYFLQLGEGSRAATHVEAVLGTEVSTPLETGHDGYWFWVLARDPALLDDTTAAQLDRPLYRAQRIAFPALAAPFAVVGEWVLLWAMPLINLAAVALGSFVVGRWSAERGGSGLVAYVYALNPVSWLATLFNLGDAVALTGLVTALYAFDRQRDRLVVPAAAVAVLARETSLAGLVAVALTVRSRSRRARILLVVPAAVAASAWRGYLVAGASLGGGAGVRELSVVPLAGLRDAWSLVWRPGDEWGQATAGTVLVALAVGCLVLWVRDRRAVLLTAAAPFALTTLFVTWHVFTIWFNLVRAVGPALALVAIHLFGPWRTAEGSSLGVGG